MNLLVVSGEMPRSMRCVRVAELLAEEVGQPFSGGSIQGEGLQADALVSEPDAQPAMGQGTHADFGVGLFKRLGLGGLLRWLHRHRRR